MSGPLTGVQIDRGRIGDALLRKGWRQQDLVRAIGSRPSAISRILARKRCSLTCLRRIAAALDVPVTALLKDGRLQ